MIEILWTIAYLAVIFAWLSGRPSFYLTLGRTPPRLLHTISAEIHPFMPYVYLTNLAISVWGEPPIEQSVSYAVTGLALAGWFVDRDDDDRWKRRRRKLAGKVRRAGARLVVAPAGAR